MKPSEGRLVRIENPKGRFWQENKKKRFKVNTQKGSLNYKKMKRKKRKKKMRGQVENLKGRLDYKKDT